MTLPVSDVTMRALRAGIAGLDTRRQAIESNIANAETPGYRALQVSFEDSLAAATRAGNPEGMSVSTTRSTDPVRANGNNVAIDREVTAASENALHHQLLIAALNHKYSLLRTAIQG